MGFSYIYINSQNEDNLTFASYLHMLHLLRVCGRSRGGGDLVGSGKVPLH